MSVPKNSLLQQRCSSYTDETSLLGNNSVQSSVLDECIYFNSNDATHISVNISFIGDVVDLQNNLTCAIARHWSAVALLFLSYVRLTSLLVYLTCSSLARYLLVSSTCLLFTHSYWHHSLTRHLHLPFPRWYFPSLFPNYSINYLDSLSGNPPFFQQLVLILSG